MGGEKQGVLVQARQAPGGQGAHAHTGKRSRVQDMSTNMQPTLDEVRVPVPAERMSQGPAPALSHPDTTHNRIPTFGTGRYCAKRMQCDPLRKHAKVPLSGLKHVPQDLSAIPALGRILHECKRIQQDMAHEALHMENNGLSSTAGRTQMLSELEIHVLRHLRAVQVPRMWHATEHRA